jgi:hypothetical protein
MMQIYDVLRNKPSVKKNVIFILYLKSMTVINCNSNIPTFFFGLLIIDLKQYIKEIIGM